MLNRKFAQLVVMASLTGGLSLVHGVAAAQASAGAAEQAHHPHGAKPGLALIHAALKLDSLSSEQRASIEALKTAERDASVPVHAAEAQVLTALAGQVEAGAINTQAVTPAVAAAEQARAALRAAGLDAAQKLHDLLTPAQRDQLVSTLESKMAEHGAGPEGRGNGEAGPREGHGPLAYWSAKLGLTPTQQAQIVANLKGATPDSAGEGADRAAHRAERQRWLESFRGEGFNAKAGAPLAPARDVDQHLEHVLQAAVPVLTPAQRTQVAAELRARAAHAPQAHGEHA